MPVLYKDIQLYSELFTVIISSKTVFVSICMLFSPQNNFIGYILILVSFLRNEDFHMFIQKYTGHGKYEI